MFPISFDCNPYTFNALILMIFALLGALYTLRRSPWTPSLYWVAGGMSAFFFSMTAMFLQSFVYWGSGFLTLIDAFAVLATACMVFFAYAYPTRLHTAEARLMRFIAAGLTISALAIGFYYAAQGLFFNRPGQPIAEYFWLFNPLTFLLALLAGLRRTYLLQAPFETGTFSLRRIFIHPPLRTARLMRNFTLAMSIGLIQGLVSLPITSISAYLGQPMLVACIVLSMELMVAALVYASFELTPQQPSLVTRLVGLTLVTVLVLLGSFGIFQVYQSAGWIIQQNISAIVQSDGENLPPGSAYRYNHTTGQLRTAAGVTLTAAQLTTPADQTAVVWNYNIEGALMSIAKANAVSSVARYGNLPPGSIHQYTGILLERNGETLEYGLDLAAISLVSRSESMGMLWAIILAALFILFIFPAFFKTNLVAPLDNLLKGVRHANDGDLSIRVPVTHNDEIGYLTSAFNKMTASLKAELDGRLAAENELRRFNLTLEERVSDRTRELEALFDITAASSQATDIQSVLPLLLARCQLALRATVSFIMLTDDASDACRLTASAGLPDDWASGLAAYATLCWVGEIAAQGEPVLIASTRTDLRLPEEFRRSADHTLLLAPLTAEGQSHGILALARAYTEAFDLNEVALLVSLANQVGLAVSAARMRQRLQEASLMEERQRLARDLHDSVTQSLYGLVTLTEVGQIRLEAGNSPAAAELFKRIGQTARQAIREMRLFIHQLRLPVLAKEGLINALDLRLAAVEGRSDIQASLNADESIRLPVDFETALYHIAQEALNNSLKHASAKTITVNLLRNNQQIELQIIDDGCGFDPAAAGRAGMGLHNMLSRAAEIQAACTIDSQPGSGTRVTVTLEEPA
jgi:signal transduction histidine kinase